MGTLDLYTDDFPHGTPAGWDKGCRGAACPNHGTEHMMCKEAFTRYQSDLNYRRGVDAGTASTLKELIAESPVKVTAAGAAYDRRDERTVEDSREPIPPAAPLEPDEEELARQRAAKTGIPYEKHGTANAYKLGCRDRDTCPGIQRVGKSCTQAVADYQREYTARKRADAGSAQTPTGAAETPTETEAGAPVDPLREQLADRQRELTAALAALEEERAQHTAEIEAHRATRLELVGVREQLVATLIPTDAQVDLAPASPADPPLSGEMRLTLGRANTRGQLILHDPTTETALDVQVTIGPEHADTGARELLVTVTSK